MFRKPSIGRPTRHLTRRAARNVKNRYNAHAIAGLTAHVEDARKWGPYRWRVVVTHDYVGAGR